MMWILISGIALVLGVMLYNKLEPDLPEWARVSVPSATSQYASESTKDKTGVSKEQLFYARNANSWSFRETEQIKELSRDSIDSIQYQGHTVDPPVLYVYCQNNTDLFIFADIKLYPLKMDKDFVQLTYML